VQSGEAGFLICLVPNAQRVPTHQFRIFVLTPIPLAHSILLASGAKSRPNG